MNEDLERLTADDFARIKLTDDEKARLREINQAREQKRQASVARIRVEEGPLVAELQAIGLGIKSVGDLIARREKYTEAIPILLKHLQMPYSDKVKAGIARSLAVVEPAVQRSWALIASEYCKAPKGWGIVGPGDTTIFRYGAKDALAHALAVSVTDDKLPDLIALAKDRTQGESRVLLLSALKRRRNQSQLVKQAIYDLAGDRELQKEIAAWG